MEIEEDNREVVKKGNIEIDDSGDYHLQHQKVTKP